ncbi:acyltransferase [Parasphingopyxis sp.]|uniref:acyltransferase family protein n=1 Tax=Parasphingopyxis sp. TaxID=1920299 RepID=UPI002606E200|nr:acyltransferase [Parasphingopyxis sp.]
MTAKPDLAALTALRGIAAWYVVLYHIRTSSADLLPPFLLDIFAKGYLAVDFFFLLSGFVIWLSYRDRIAENGIAAIPGFLARRFARIYPLHFVILCGAMVFALVLAATGRSSPEAYPWQELPLHLLLIQNWGFTTALSWNDPAWSISVEMAAYLLFPLIALGTDWRAISTPILLALIGLFALALHSFFVAMDAPILDANITQTGLLRCLIQFTIGTILCALWLRWRDRAIAMAALSAAGGIAVGALALTGVIAETLAVPLAFSGLLLTAALTATMPRNPLAARPLHYLGEISYATYLAHFLLFVLFKLLFVDDSGQIGAGGLAGFLVLTFIVSALLYHLVERPAQRTLNKQFEKLFARKPQTA